MLTGTLYCEVLHTSSINSSFPMWNKGENLISLGENLISFSNLYFYKHVVNFEVNYSIPKWWNRLDVFLIFNFRKLVEVENSGTHFTEDTEEKKRDGDYIWSDLFGSWKHSRVMLTWQVFHRVFNLCGKTKVQASGRNRAHPASPPKLQLVSSLPTKCSLKETSQLNYQPETENGATALGEEQWFY